MFSPIIVFGLFIALSFFSYGCYKLKAAKAAYVILGFVVIAVLKGTLDLLNISNQLF